MGESLYGKVRLQASSRDGQPVFAGIARTSDVNAYLRGTAHSTLTDLEVDPFVPSYRTTPGTRTPARPGAQDFWVASAEGTGTRTLNWDVEDGDYSVVLMNADGSPRVDARSASGPTCRSSANSAGHSRSPRSPCSP